MKYRIIKEINGNKDAFFELHLYKSNRFGISSWSAVVEYQRLGDWFKPITKKFKTIEEVESKIKELTIERVIVNSGEIYCDYSNSYKVK